MQIYKAQKKQSLGAAVLSKTSVSSVTGGTPGKYVQSHVDGEVGCSTDAVQQQWMSDHPDLCEFLVGLHRIWFFQIRPGPEFAGFGTADPAGAGDGAECSWAGGLGYIT